MVSGELHAQAALNPVPIGYEAGWAPNRSGHSSEERSPCPCQESNPGRPVRIIATMMTDLLWLF
jgi:hypothetical protein